MATSTATKQLPLRERKKELLRQAILASAQRLFEARGYEAVTVAEIADAADVSVKTLFTYFRTKDELVFQDTGLIDGVMAALARRGKNTSHAAAVAKALVRACADDEAGVLASLDGYHRGYAAAESLQPRLLKLWAEYEERVAAFLAEEAGLAAPTGELRFYAAQLVGLIRATTWTEVRDLVAEHRSEEAQAAALAGFLRRLAARVDKGQKR